MKPSTVSKREFRRDWGAFKRHARTELKQVILSCENDVAATGVQVARDNSSGPYSLPFLRKVGHPYSRINPNPAFDPYQINRQSSGPGSFWAGWRSRQGTPSKSPAIENVSRVAVFLEASTKTGYRGRMTSRDVSVPIRAALRKELLANLQFAFRGALTP